MIVQKKIRKKKLFDSLNVIHTQCLCGELYVEIHCGQNLEGPLIPWVVFGNLPLCIHPTIISILCICNIVCEISEKINDHFFLWNDHKMKSHFFVISLHLTIFFFAKAKVFLNHWDSMFSLIDLRFDGKPKIY